MCYSAQAACLRELDYARRRGTPEDVDRILEFMRDMGWNEPKFYVSGFSHPKLLCFTNEEPMKPQALTWGLIPGWTKTIEDGKKFWNNTLNARGETIWEKPSFKSSAKNKRCLIYVDSFYEHHHVGKNTYPFRIYSPDNQPLIFAGLWDEWVDKSSGEIFKTCTIVTTEGNPMMSKIHNNPKAEMGPRMPVILTKETQNEWLIDCKTDLDKKHLQDLIKPYKGELRAYTVGRINGKSAMPNTPEAVNEVEYPEFELDLSV